MTPEASPRAGLHPSIVLSAYVEPLVRGRRVAILGDATIGLADELSQRGARLVHAYDPDAARTAEALARAAPGRPHQVTHAVLAGDLGVRDGAFDVVVVPDLSIFDDAADTMRRARRLCAATGVAVFVTPNLKAGGRRLLPGGTPAAEGGATQALGYYELYDLVALQFAKVRMIGQAPFVGYTIADFAPGGDPAVSVDTSLLASSEEPEHFIAVASDRPLTLDPYAVIELPWSEVADAILPASSSPQVGKLALDEAEARLALLVTELDRAREREAEGQREAAARAEPLAALSARVAELEGELASRDARLKEAEARAGDNHVRAERLGHQIRDLDEELRRQRDRGTRLSKQLDDEKKARTKVELELGMLRGRPEIAGGKDRIDALGAELEAARARLAELELEQAETRRKVAPPPAAPDPKLMHRLNELEQAVNAALREASEAATQRDAALDRVAKLEARLERAAAVEARLAGEQQEKADLAEHARVSAAMMAEIELRFAAERGRAGEAEKRATASARKLAEAEQRVAGAEQRVAGAERQLADAAPRIAQAERRAAEREAQIAAQAVRIGELEAELAGARQKLAAERDGGGAAEAATAELAALEAALRERGRAVTALERDLRESERVGKELLDALEAAGVPAGDAPPEDLRARLDALAAGAARSEANLQAATWRIAQLERELSEARREAPLPSSVQIELEQALSAARDEVASLRRALGGGAS
jgi:chromosome segregation ATPase